MLRTSKQLGCGLCICRRYQRLVTARHGRFLVNALDMYIGHALTVLGEWSETETRLFGAIVDAAARDQPPRLRGRGQLALDVGEPPPLPGRRPHTPSLRPPTWPCPTVRMVQVHS